VEVAASPRPAYLIYAKHALVNTAYAKHTNEDSVARPEQFPIKKVIGFDRQMMDALDAYRREQDVIPNLSEAIRSILRDWLHERGHLPGPDRK
jgi:hypothetical protein